MIVVDADGNEWPAYLTPLATWLAERRVERYFVRWRAQAPEARSLGLFALPHVVQPAVLQNLSAGNTVIVPHLLASVGGLPMYREPNVLDSLVRRSLALVIDRNLKASADRYGSPQFGSHLEALSGGCAAPLGLGRIGLGAQPGEVVPGYGSDGLVPAVAAMRCRCTGLARRGSVARHTEVGRYRPRSAALLRAWLSPATVLTTRG